MLRSALTRHISLAARSTAAALGGLSCGALPAATAGGGLAAATAVGTLHTCAPLLASLQVKIPALGESISDGTVAAVLKEAGQQVEEDEPIIQIETDKVTVDVRAPRAGVIEAILVKPDQNVEVGHVVASIAEGATAAAPAEQQQQQAAAAAAPQATPSPQAAPAAPQAAASAAGAGAEAEAAAPPQRAPSIRFPPRRSPAGEQISALPREQAEQLLASLVGGAGADVAASEAAPPKPAPIPKKYQHMIAVPIVGGSQPILRGMPVPSGAPGPPRRTMTDAEMEAIMLGGAEP